MRNIVLYYLLLPLFAGLSFTFNAAADPNSAQVKQLAPTHVGQSEPRSNKSGIDLNTADAATLQKELNGIGRA